jgi:hypothetical protein
VTRKIEYKLPARVEAGVRQEQQERDNAEIAAIERLIGWQIRYRTTVRNPILLVLSKSGLAFTSADITELENDTWGQIWGWLQGEDVRTMIRGTSITKGTRIKDVQECTCAISCKCPKTEPNSLQRWLHKITKSAAESWRTAHRARDQRASNEKKNARLRGDAVAELPDTQPESVWNSGPRLKKVPRFLGYLDDLDVMELDSADDYAEEPTPTRGKKAREKPSVEDRSQEFDRKGWSAAPSLRMSPAVMERIIDHPNGESRSTLEAWRRDPNPIRYATQEEWDRWMENSTSFQESRALTGYRIDWYMTARESPDAPKQQEKEGRTENEKLWLYHRELKRVKLLRHLRDGERTWVFAKKKPVMVNTADLCSKKWPKEANLKAA